MIFLLLKSSDIDPVVIDCSYLKQTELKSIHAENLVHWVPRV